MKKNKTSVSPFILVLIPILLGLVFLANQANIEIPTEKYSASIHFQMPELGTVVRFVYACFNW